MNINILIKYLMMFVEEYNNKWKKKRIYFDGKIIYIMLYRYRMIIREYIVYKMNVMCLMKKKILR